MYMLRLTFLFVLLLPFCRAGLFGQSRCLSAGATAIGTGGTLSYSLGLVDYLHTTHINGEIEEGLQHPFEHFLLGTLPSRGNESVTIFPNPAHQLINISIQDPSWEGMCATLYDAQGKFLRSAPLTGPEMVFQLGNQAQGIYFLHLLAPNSRQQTFKIIQY